MLGLQCLSHGQILNTRPRETYKMSRSEIKPADPGETVHTIDRDIPIRDFRDILRRIQQNYIFLKEEICPVYLVDHLIAGELLTEDEGNHIKMIRREDGADFILKKALRVIATDKLDCFINALIAQDQRYLLDRLHPEKRAVRIPTEHDMVDNIGDFEIKRRLQHNTSYLIEELNARDYIDMFFQEGLITINDHDDMSHRHRHRKDVNKEFLLKVLAGVPRTFYYLLKVLKEKGAGHLVRQLEDSKNNPEVQDETLIDVNVTLKDGRIYRSATLEAGQNIEELRFVMTKSPSGGSQVYLRVKEHVPGSEEHLIHAMHATIKSSNIGSLIIYLQAESDDVRRCLNDSVRDNSISHLLRHLFDHADVRELLDEGTYDLEIIVEKCDQGATKTALDEPVQSIAPVSHTGLRDMIFQNTSLLKEEFDPLVVSGQLQEKNICQSHLNRINHMQNRRQRTAEFVKALLEEPDEKISEFLTLLKDKEKYIYDHLNPSPETEGNPSINSEEVRKGILANFSFLVDEIDVTELKTDFTGKNILPEIYFKELSEKHTCRRDRAKMFLKSILKIGSTAIESFVFALESRGLDYIKDKLQTSPEERKRDNFAENDEKITYDVYDEDNGVLFHGNFRLTVTKRGANQEIYKNESEGVLNPRSSQDSSSKDTVDSKGSKGGDDDLPMSPRSEGNFSESSQDSRESDVNTSDSESETSASHESSITSSHYVSSSSEDDEGKYYLTTNALRGQTQGITHLDHDIRESLEEQSAKLQGFLTAKLGDCEAVSKLMHTFSQVTVDEIKEAIENMIGRNTYSKNKEIIKKLYEIDYQLHALHRHAIDAT